MNTEPRALADIILAEVQHIESAYSSSQKAFPSLDNSSAEPFIEDPIFERSASVAIAAASRLIASLRNPHAAVHMLACSMYTSSFMGIVVEANITEVLQEAGPQGMDIRDLAAAVQMNPIKLGQTMRYLCAMHYTYQEVAPDVFANNRISMTLDTGKPFETIKDRGPTRYDLAEGSAAIAAYTAGHCIIGAPKMAEVALNRKITFSEDPADSPLLRGLHTSDSYYQWLKHPDNKKTMNQFGAAMRTVGEIWSPSTTASAFNWSALRKGSLVVDVGGGHGGSTLALVKAHPGLRYIIQDKLEMVTAGEQHWSAVNPQALETGVVQFQVHDFFEPQLIKDASVFLLRLIFHNWTNSYSKRILDALRAAATPQTRLVLLELVIPYTCPDDGKHANIPGATPLVLPQVLKGNPGPSNATAFVTDAQMFNLLNAQARTVGQWVELLASARWVIEEIREAGLSSIICKPV